MNPVRKYLWDFSGGHGEGTAKQFRLHLDEFVRAEKLEGCETGVEPWPGKGYSAFCLAPLAAQPIIERELKPPRYTEES